jgi:hypothetical protein
MRTSTSGAPAPPTDRPGEADPAPRGSRWHPRRAQASRGGVGNSRRRYGRDEPGVPARGSEATRVRRLGPPDPRHSVFSATSCSESGWPGAYDARGELRSLEIVGSARAAALWSLNLVCCVSANSVARRSSPADRDRFAARQDHEGLAAPAGVVGRVRWPVPAAATPTTVLVVGSEDVLQPRTSASMVWPVTGSSLPSSPAGHRRQRPTSRPTVACTCVRRDARPGRAWGRVVGERPPNGRAPDRRRVRVGRFQAARSGPCPRMRRR